MAKRSATTELNHDNWNDEEAPEEAGTFQKATADELKKRVIKTAKRRNPGLGNGGTKSAFAGFGGFGSTTSIPKTANFTFGLGNNSSSSPSNGTKAETSTAVTASQMTSTTTVASAVSESSTATEGTSTENSHSREYYAQLKGLNESVSAWIKTHVDKNPICILTPIFRDYERHLMNIEATESQKKKDNACESSSKLSKTSENTGKLAHDNTYSFTLGSKTSTTNTSTSATTTSTAPTSSFFGSPGGAQSTTPAFLVGSGFTFGKKVDDPKDKSIKNEVNPFLSGSKETFNFGQAQSSVGGSNASFPSAGFTFGGSTTFTFYNPAKTEPKKEEETAGEKDEEEDEAPKDEFKPIIEDDAIYTKRCKLFVKKEGKFNECGVGTLHIKPVSEEEKTKKKIQVVVRADNAIGTVLLNVLYGGSASLPTPTRVGKNNVMLVCPLPSEPDNKPMPVLVRVKEESDADELLKQLTDLDK